MNKKIGVSCLFALTCLVSSFCFSCGENKPVDELGHEHKLSTNYRQNAKEHRKVCNVAGCDGIFDRGNHVGYPCEVCGASFKAIAFYTGINDQAHVAFCDEAREYFTEAAKENNFLFEMTNDWTKLNEDIFDYDLVMFLDTRPEDELQRYYFEEYMESGGAFIGYHFSAFALKGSSYDDNWDWYQDEFLECGEYKDNTWAPTKEILKVETHDHYSTRNLPKTFESSCCEWYSWDHDLTKKENIEVLLSIDESSFPVGTNAGEIWYEGYYPITWTNLDYNMIYSNMGHNDVNYGNATYDSIKEYTFKNEYIQTFTLDSMFGLTRDYEFEI